MTQSTTELSSADAVTQIRPLYCRFIDTKQWARLLALFADDATFDGFTFVRPGASPSDFVSDLSTKLADAVTVHHCHAPELSINGDEARATWPMADTVEWPEEGRLNAFPSATGFNGAGFYEEGYRLVGGVWRISFLRLTRTRIEPTRNGVRVPDYDPFAMLDGYAAPSDAWVSDPQTDHRR